MRGILTATRCKGPGMVRCFCAFAKINLYLAVLGKRDDGYHDVDTVLQSVDLSDRLIFAETRPGRLEVRCDAAGVPEGPANLVWKALALLRTRYRPATGLSVRIEKGIPVQAGLGGGSADAACALAAANRIWALGLSDDELEGYGAELGSDVPFFVRGGTRRCRGRGERTEALIPLADSLWAIVKPPWGLSTAAVFACAGAALTSHEANIRMVLGHLAKRDLGGLAGWIFNDLESAAQQLHPEVGEIKSWMTSLGVHGVVQAGSGSAWVGLCSNPRTAADLAAQGPARGWAVFLVRPVKGGWIEAAT